MEENKTVVEAAPVAAPAVEETKKSVLNASVAPENFDWDAFENDDVYGGFYTCGLLGLQEEKNVLTELFPNPLKIRKLSIFLRAV